MQQILGRSKFWSLKIFKPRPDGSLPQDFIKCISSLDLLFIELFVYDRDCAQY